MSVDSMDNLWMLDETVSNATAKVEATIGQVIEELIVLSNHKVYTKK